VRTIVVAVAAAVTCAASSNAAAQAPRLIMARGELLEESRLLARSGNRQVLEDYGDLLHAADSVMKVPPLSVMQKAMMPPSGNKHDYMSLAPYWWPDSTKPGGVPYIRRDGQMNPQSRIDHDGLRLQRTIDAVQILALAYYFNNKTQYAARAAQLLRVFFIDPATRMNPNLNYAQAVPGVNQGRGIGIIDTRHMAQLVDAVRLLSTYPGWTSADAAAFRRWCTAYLTWLRTSTNGREEKSQTNNHGTWYDAQVAALALFVGDTRLARSVIGTSARQRVDSQIAGDGAQPMELERTRPMHYSLFNLDAFTQLAEMGRHVGVNLWTYKSPKGGNLIGALRFLAPFSYTANRWPKADVTPFTSDVVVVPFRRASAVTSDTVLMLAAERADSVGGSPRWWRLFYPGTPAVSSNSAILDRALKQAASKVVATAVELDPARGYPRSIDANGRWTQLPLPAWTSGFFAGTLWYLSQYDHTRKTRSLAERWTIGLEPAKDIRTTHDLGFIVFNSFGHGFLETGNAHYRDVVLAASRSLASRYNSRVGAIKSWDTDSVADARRGWTYPVIIDNMMNLEMLFWAARHGGDPYWTDIARTHAMISMRAHIRSDGSTAHVALFDPISGRLDRTVTWQGYSDSSAWARGQAWAIYGFTTAYKYGRWPEFLNAAERTADWFLAHLPRDGIPYWDMRHPHIPHTERDASAAAIAASGLLDLSRQVSGSKSAVYRGMAQRILQTLATEYTDTTGKSSAILQHAVGNRPQNSEVDVGLVYADYYFVEALLRERGMYRPR
jgi:hypothetical protein